MPKPFMKEMNQLIELQQRSGGLNHALENLYPIAIARDDKFLIFDLAQEASAYQFRKSAPTPMPIPVGERAAFQLEDYGGRIACVVTPEVFDSLDGYVTILHEFVHCYQYETCEQELKKNLDIARQAKERGHVMWEIQHPFPYSAVNFTEPYSHFITALRAEEQNEILRSRRRLKDYLGLHDYEYMVWQEWKEGFARWIENLVKREIGLKENRGGLAPPYSRISFYAGGEAYIDYLAKNEPELTNDLRALFQKLYAF